MFGGRHALAGFSITQLPLIFNCFLCLAQSSTFHSVSRTEKTLRQRRVRNGRRGEMKERLMGREGEGRDRSVDVMEARQMTGKGGVWKRANDWYRTYCFQ